MLDSEMETPKVAHGAFTIHVSTRRLMSTIILNPRISRFPIIAFKKTFQNQSQVLCIGSRENKIGMLEYTIKSN